VALLVFFLVDGFLVSYLWTRLHLAGALRHADEASRLAAVESKLDIIDVDAKAWSTVQRILTSPADDQPPQKEINATIAPATGTMKAQIFWEAQHVRSSNWRKPEGKRKMERTIPIFRALIASDTENLYHANHGQLGYALKDKRNPDYEEAFRELTEAINLRGNWEKSGWAPYYEFARALCRMNLDEASKTGKKSDDKTKGEIIADLEVAFSNPEVRKNALTDPEIKAWLKLNEVTL
jgi:hypothetical protein